MAILKILQYPNPRLRIKAKPVEDVKNPEIQKIIDDMFETMYNEQGCAGLSSTQLDLKNPLRISVIDESPDNAQPFCLINPIITHKEGEATYSEGCMSIYPGENIYANVKRADKITFKALDRDGNNLEMAAEGLFSICIQHELDHLDGILFIDHISPLKRKMLEKKIIKIRRRIKC